MLKVRDRRPGLDQGRDLFGMGGVQTEAVADETPRWPLDKMDFYVYMHKYMHTAV